MKGPHFAVPQSGDPYRLGRALKQPGLRRRKSGTSIQGYAYDATCGGMDRNACMVCVAMCRLLA